jgi:2-polyprenyl-3-methyl-5-hydroxy-6-metoxy-1,4-benzoquinol methylase
MARCGIARRRRRFLKRRHRQKTRQGGNDDRRFKLTTKSRRLYGTLAAPHYEDIGRGIADSIEHCMLRLDPKRGERILDLATGTGWTSRALARRGAKVTGVDISEKLIETAIERAKKGRRSW